MQYELFKRKKEICRVLSVHKEIAYSFSFTWRRQKYVKSKTTEILKDKQASIAAVREKTKNIVCYLLDPSYFSLQTIPLRVCLDLAAEEGTVKELVCRGDFYLIGYKSFAW